MRRGKRHLRLVGAELHRSAPIVDAIGDLRGITAVVQNVTAGQVCEMLHRKTFSLSGRVVVAEEDTSVTITSFALQHGRYEVSVRIDGELEPDTVSATVVVVGPPAAVTLPR